jgi:hypothetical protein
MSREKPKHTHRVHALESYGYFHRLREWAAKLDMVTTLNIYTKILSSEILAII